MVDAIQYVCIFFIITALICRATQRKVVYVDSGKVRAAVNELAVAQSSSPAMADDKKIEPTVPSKVDLTVDNIEENYALDNPIKAGSMSDVLDLKKDNKPMAIRVSPYKNLHALQKARRQLTARLNDCYRCPTVISH